MFDMFQYPPGRSLLYCNWIISNYAPELCLQLDKHISLSLGIVSKRKTNMPSLELFHHIGSFSITLYVIISVNRMSVKNLYFFLELSQIHLQEYTHTRTDAHMCTHMLQIQVPQQQGCANQNTKSQVLSLCSLACGRCNSSTAIFQIFLTWENISLLSPLIRM